MFWTLNRCDLVHVIFVLNLTSVNISPNESSHSNVSPWHEAWCKKTSTQFQCPNVIAPICFNSWSTITTSQLYSRAHLQPSAFTGQTLPANCRGKNKYIKETPSLMLIEVKCSIVLIWGPARAYLSTRAVWGLNEGATQQPHCSAKYERAVPDENGNNKHVSPLEAQILRRRRRQELVSRVGIQCGAFLCGVYTAQRHASVVNCWF